jgi:hypothetical protein
MQNRKNDYQESTENYNLVLLKKYRVSLDELNRIRKDGEIPPDKLPELEKKEEALYQKYLKALETVEVPHARTVLNFFEVLSKSKSPWIRSLPERIKRRRIIILYESGLGDEDLAYGQVNLGCEGDRRPVKTYVENGKRKTQTARMNGVIRIKDQFADSLVGTTALGVHEFWHILAKELRENGLSMPVVDEKDLANDEHWADYNAGLALNSIDGLDSYDFYNALHDKALNEERAATWGSDWREIDLGPILHKLNLFRRFKGRIEPFRIGDKPVLDLPRLFNNGLNAGPSDLGIGGGAAG